MKNRLLILFISVIFISSCANDDAQKTLKNIPQNVMQFVDVKTENDLLVSSAQQKLLYRNYLQHYFSPWTGKSQINSKQEIQQAENNFVTKYTADPGWGENFQKHQQSWINNIASNMAMDAFPNANIKAITTDATDMRLLPTNEVSFKYWKIAGEGYPFDNLQESHINANAPVLILHQSKDKAWDLVLEHNDFGWLPSKYVAEVNESFIKKWMTNDFIALIKDDVSIIDKKNNFHFTASMGVILPFVSKNNHRYQILIASANLSNEAVIERVQIQENNAVPMPLTLTVKNIATLANSLLGKPYGWGGIYGYRDCSSTIEDLFTPFAYWLPRNSADQLSANNFISFENMSSSQKAAYIKNNGIPFFTLIGLPGHIMLYLGQKNGEAYVMHDFWGLHTQNIFMQKGRAHIGQTIVTPLSFGKGYINVRKTLLQQVNGIRNM